MDNKPSFDRSLLIPIGVGIFSVMGICVILVMGRIKTTRATVEEVPTATQFQYAFIGTEPAISTVTLDGIEGEGRPTLTAGVPTSAPRVTPDLLPTNTFAPIITLPPLEDTNTPTRTPTSASTAPFGPGTYDDIDSLFIYSGDWDSRSGVTGAEKNTLHVSETLGNSVTFRYSGIELIIFFQGGTSLGTIRVTIDNTSSLVNQSDYSGSTQLPFSATSAGIHTVTITHLSGGSVNLDQIVVSVVPPTPGNSPTPTVENQ
jgi:hypothetical protein